MSTIDWIPIDECPEELKDGRTVLVWCEGWRGSAPAFFCRIYGLWCDARTGDAIHAPDCVAPMPKGPEVGGG